MSFLGGVLPSPHERVRQALMADLELRRKAAVGDERFSGCHYLGGADLVIRHGVFYPGRVLPEQYRHLMGQPSRCYVNALEAVQQDPSLLYCEGYYTTGFGSPMSHGWCVAPDGGVVELTMPTVPEELARYHNSVGMKYVPAERWGYYGVIFAPALADAHWNEVNGGLPMLDRSAGELREAARVGKPHLTERQHFPILKLPYDPNRQELP